MSELKCIHSIFHSLNNTVDQCIASYNCEFNYINLIKTNYCTVHNNFFILFISILLLLYLFYSISDTSNNYLAPALGLICDKIHLSQNLAGLTLLALGNQAPDIICALVSSSSTTEGVEASLGTILGGGLIVSCLVLSTIIYLAKSVYVIPENFIRDLLVYFIAILIIIFFGYNQSISLYNTLFLFSCIYNLCYYLLSYG